MEKAPKKLVTKNQVQIVLDLGDKNRENKKMSKVWFSYFVGKGYFDDDGPQSYLMFQPIYKILRNIYQFN